MTLGGHLMLQTPAFQFPFEERRAGLRSRWAKTVKEEGIQGNDNVWPPLEIL